MKRYKEYKDSGVEWIGEIPSHWEVLPMRYLLQLIQTGSTPSTSIDEFFDGDIKWFTPGDFSDDKYLSKCNRCLTRLAIDKNESKLLPKDTVLLVGIGATLGKVAMINEESSFNQQITGLVTNKKIVPQFLYYWLKMNNNTLLKTSNFTTLPIVNNEFIKSFPTICPSTDEQKIIVSYLDKKTSQIENLISKKEELIETLKASRTKLISETVTKGLDKNVPMKDSGVEWIGDIPNHWDISKLKFNSKSDFMYGANESGEDIQENHPRYIRITDIDEMGNLKDETYTTLDYKKAKPYILEDGDILFARSGATVGKTFLYEQKKYGIACFAGYLIKFNPDKLKCNSKYMYYYTQSRMYEDFININISQATIQNVSAEKYKNLYNPLPPLKEQEEIVIYLDNKTLKIDKLINSIKEQIELLKKAKQKLITEVVTGKIDVTNL